MVKNVKIDPWFQLVAQNARWRREHPYEHIWDAESLEQKLRRIRQEYMGSGISLQALVRENDKPIESAVCRLAEFLGDQTAAHMGDPSWSDYMFYFFYYTIQLYAHGCVGGECVDDLIQMSLAHEHSPEILAIICEMDLSAEMAAGARDWVMENNHSPNGMTKYVTAAVAALLGVVPAKDLLDA